MKKLIAILLCLPLLFTTCKKEEEEENNPDSPFVGYWSGNYSGDYDGHWNGTISSSGDINGTATIDESPGLEIDLNGTVTNSGIANFAATTGTGSLGVNFIGELNGNSGSGTWSSATDSSIGTWDGHNYNQ